MNSFYSYREMPCLHKWACGRPTLVAMICHSLATSSLLAGDLVQLVRSGTAANAVYDHVGNPCWLNLYRQPAKVRAHIKSLGIQLPANIATAAIQKRIDSRVPGSGKAASALLESAPPEARQQVFEMTRVAFGCLYMEQCAQIVEILHDCEENGSIDMDEALRLPEFQFFLLVGIPSFLEYGQSPWRIYANARRGDKESLDALLRLDKTVLSDPAIGNIAARFGMQRSEFDIELVAKAYQGVPVTKQTARKIKARLAARMQDVAKGMGYELRPSPIRELFDALSKDRTGDPHAIDTDIHDDPGAWRQAVKQERSGRGGLKPFWHIDLPRDNIDGAKCRAEIMRVAVVSDFDESETLPTCFTNPGEPEPTGSWWQRLRAKCYSTAQRLQAALRTG